MNRKISFACLSVVFAGIMTTVAIAGEPPKLSPAQIIYQGEAQLMQARAGLLNAQSTFIRAIAEARANDAKTLNMLEQTRSVSLDNTLKAAKTYYDRRQARDTYVSMQTRPKARPAVSAQPTSAVRTVRLTEAQFDAATGKVRWPAALQLESLAQYRAQVDALLAARAQGKAPATFQAQLTTLAKNMENVLRSHIRDMTPSEYLAAKRFLQAVAAEGRYNAPAALAYNP
ncbi:hypothetical protein JCM19992_11180 [Thermostilla marina]